TTEDMWTAFHNTFSSASQRDTYPMRLRQALSPKTKHPWANMNCVKLWLGRSASSPDHVTWAHIKKFLLDPHILEVFTWLCNSCLLIGHWPDYFKLSKTVIIPKPN